MQKGVLPLNAFLAFLYLALTGLTAFMLKLSLRRRHRKPIEESSLQKPELNYHKLLGVSLLKKLTIVGSCFNSEKRYLLKQMLFVGVFAICSLGINSIILWPAVLAMGLLPLSILLLDLVTPTLGEKCQPQEAVENDRRQVGEVVCNEVKVDCERIESAIALPSHSESRSQPLKNVSSASLVEMLILGMLSLGSMVLLLEVMMTIGTSESNSGQLNISSVLLCLLVDQLGVRFGFILAIFIATESLQAAGLIDIENSPLIANLCEQEINIQLDRLAKDRLKRASLREVGEQHSASPFKAPNSNKAASEELDLENMQVEDSPIHSGEQPSSSQVENSIVAHSPVVNSGIVDWEANSPYLTTPEKELFQDEKESGVSMLGSAYLNGVECDVGTEMNKSTLGVAQPDKKTTLELLIDQNHPHGHSQFTLDESMDGREGRGRRGGQRRRKAKRVIKITGDSPYLEYLPNMLKNVQNYKGHHGPPKKML